MEQITTDEKRVQEIVAIVKSMKDNDAAHFSMVTHVIFSDYNLGQAVCEKALEDHAGWTQYIKDKAQEMRTNTMGYNFSEVIKDVIAVHEALYKLSCYTEAEHDTANILLSDYAPHVQA